MTAVNPPTYVVSTYNPSFFETTTTGLTQGQANTLYLKKTVADTATGLETFAGGIITPTIDTNAYTSNYNFIPNLGSTTTMGIGCAAPTYGTIQTIQIGSTTGTSVHAGGIDCTGPTINGAVQPYAGTLSLGSSQTTGVIEIGGGTRNTGGIGGAINIGNNPNSSTPINIGTGLNMTTNIGSLSVAGNSINNAVATGDILIGSTQTSATGSIGIGIGAGRSSSIAIGTGNASSVSIGYSGTLQLCSGAGAVSCGGTLSAYGLSIYGSNNIYLGDGITSPILGQLGYITPLATISATTLLTNAGTSIVGTLSLGAGVWMVNATLCFQLTAALDYSLGLIIRSASTTIAEQTDIAMSVPTATSNTSFLNATGVVALTGTTSITLLAFASYSGTSITITPSSSIFKAVRIA